MARGAIAALVGLVLLANGAAAADYANLAELVANTTRLSTLGAALEAAGLEDVATDSNLVATVFAPTDAAFTATLASLNLTAEEALNDTELLTAVLSYHIVPGEALEAELLTEGELLQTILDSPAGLLEFYTYKGLPRLATTSGQAVRIIKTDLKAGGAVVHLVDAVLVPGDELFGAPAPAPAA